MEEIFWPFGGNLCLEDRFYCDGEYQAQATCWRRHGLNSKKCIIWHFRWEIRGLRIDSIVMPKGKRKPRAGTDLALAGTVAGMGDLRYPVHKGFIFFGKNSPLGVFL